MEETLQYVSPPLSVSCRAESGSEIQRHLNGMTSTDRRILDCLGCRHCRRSSLGPRRSVHDGDRRGPLLSLLRRKDQEGAGIERVWPLPGQRHPGRGRQRSQALRSSQVCHPYHLGPFCDRSWVGSWMGGYHREIRVRQGDPGPDSGACNRTRRKGVPSQSDIGSPRTLYRQSPPPQRAFLSSPLTPADRHRHSG